MLFSSVRKICTSFSSRAVPLHYVLNSFDRSKSLIIHHGLMGSCKNFNSISKNPHISKYRDSYLLDCRNHGQSPHTDTHRIEDLAEDLYALIQRLGLEKGKPNSLALMGHSMGGLALMSFTQKYPQMQDLVSRVIIVDIGCKNREDVHQGINSTGAMLSRMLEIDLNQPTQHLFREI